MAGDGIFHEITVSVSYFPLLPAVEILYNEKPIRLNGKHPENSQNCCTTQNFYDPRAVSEFTQDGHF